MQIQSFKQWELKEKLPARFDLSNKGDYGKLLLIAGSYNMCGAAYLSAKAAYRSGVGLVYIYTEDCNRVILQQLIPEAVLITYQQDTWTEEHLLNAMKGKTAIVTGPGLGQSECAGKLVQTVLKSKLPKLLDADALNLLSKNPAWYKYAKGSFIITPHPGEMSRLIDMSVEEVQKNRSETANHFSRKHHVITVLKGNRTVVTDGVNEYINTSGNHGMATAGSGDVLAGIIGTFLAQKMDLFESAALGVYVHGLAGDEARKVRGSYSLMASDIVEYILYGID